METRRQLLEREASVLALPRFGLGHGYGCRLSGARVDGEDNLPVHGAALSAVSVRRGNVSDTDAFPCGEANAGICSGHKTNGGSGSPTAT